MKRLSFFVLFAVVLCLYSFADNTTSGEFGYQGDGVTPSLTGQATNDHLFINGDVNFHSGKTQTIWFYLDDDEIYRNAKVQALTPIAYNSSGDLYHEITYNSFQCDVYLPKGVEIVSIEDEDGEEVSYISGDRMPSTATFLWTKKNHTKVIDGKTYNVYQLLCYNTSAYGSHFSAKNASRYRNQGALKKEHTLFALFLQNNNQQLNEGRLDQDLIIANQIFGMRETSIAEWDANNSLFFYGTGGNNKSQVFYCYYRAEVYGSKGYGLNNFIMSDTSMMHGGTITIPVAMENSDAIAGFQTDLYLPQGFSVKKENGDYMVSLSSRKANDHIIMANEIEEGVVRILSYSPSIKTFAGEEGDLLYITIQAPEDGDGIYPIMLKNTLFTNSNEDEIKANDAICNLTVYPYILGDANNSGSVTITDVVVTARYILRFNPTPFVFGAADLNFDGNISITDVIKISRIVLETRTMSTNRTSLASGNNTIMRGLVSSIDNRNACSVNIQMDSPASDYTAFQFDINLPEGITAENFLLVGNNSSHVLESELIDDNTIRLICYSPDVDAINAIGNTCLTFDAIGNIEDNAVITIDGIELVTIGGETVNPDGFVIALNGTVSAKEIEAKTLISHSGQNIIIESPVNQTISITDLLGRTQVINIGAGCNTIPVAGNGFYIVNASGVTQKLMVY